jgi:uncharacterized protein (TIGR03435 family)
MVRRIRFVLTTVTLVILWAGMGCSGDKAAELTPIQVAPTPITATPGAAAGIDFTRDPTAESNVRISEANHMLVGTNLSMAEVISVAYRTPETRSLIPLMSPVRVISRSPLPADHYDVRVYVPHGQAEDFRRLLRQTLASRFGITARREKSESPVLVLSAPAGQMKPTAPPVAGGLAPNSTRLDLTGTDPALLADQLEEHLNQPVVNETRLRGEYNLRLQQPSGQAPATGPRFSVELVRAALREQLGLELTPERRTIEFLMVDGVAIGASTDNQNTR